MIHDIISFMISSQMIFIQAHTPGECETRKLILRVDSALHPS